MLETNENSKLTLVFDWGNTLMKVYPQYDGPMASWPEVAEVDGVVEALEALLRRFPMVVATNAADSSAEQVWKALRRAGLGEYFRAVFTANELGGKKPELRFFRALESVSNQRPDHMVMVGDDFRADILGAKAAGWQAIWYNPRRQAAPGLLPLHDAEIADLRDLPQAVARPRLPDYSTCMAWLIERGTPYNILAHIQLVAAIAYQLAVWVGQTGEKVNPVLTHRGALLHDLAKMDSILLGKERGRHGDHGLMARDLLLAREQPELAEIANRHMIYADPDYDRRPLTWEEKLVNYADKLAEGTHLVPVEERVHALKLRYAAAARELEESLPVVSAMQQEICDRLNISPAELVERLRHELGLRK